MPRKVYILSHEGGAIILILILLRRNGKKNRRSFFTSSIRNMEANGHLLPKNYLGEAIMLSKIIFMLFLEKT